MHANTDEKTNRELTYIDSTDMHTPDRADTCVSDRQLLTPYVMTPETVYQHFRK